MRVTGKDARPFRRVSAQDEGGGVVEQGAQPVDGRLDRGDRVVDAVVARRCRADHLVDPDLEVAHRQGGPAVRQGLLEVLRGTVEVAELVVGAGEEHLERVVLAVLGRERLVELAQAVEAEARVATDVDRLAEVLDLDPRLLGARGRPPRRRGPVHDAVGREPVVRVAVALVRTPGVDRRVVVPRLPPGGTEGLAEGQPRQHPVVERGGEGRRRAVVDGPAAGHDDAHADIDELGGEARRQAVVVPGALPGARWPARAARPAWAVRAGRPDGLAGPAGPIAPRWQQLTTTSSGTCRIWPTSPAVRYIPLPSTMPVTVASVPSPSGHS